MAPPCWGGALRNAGGDERSGRGEPGPAPGGSGDGGGSPGRQQAREGSRTRAVHAGAAGAASQPWSRTLIQAFIHPP